MSTYHIMHFHTSDKEPRILESFSNKAIAEKRIRVLAKNENMQAMGDNYWYRCFWIDGKCIGGHSYFIESEI